MSRTLLLALAVGLATPLFAADNDLRRKYEEQLKQFEEQIKKAEDPEAKKELEKARDEYKKTMEGPLKKADAEAPPRPQPIPPRPNPFGGGGFPNPLLPLNPGANADDMRKDLEALQKQLQKQLLEDMKRLNPRFDPNAPNLPGLPAFPALDPKDIDDLFNPGNNPFGGGAFGGLGGRPQNQPRLGVRVEKVPAVLAEQLDLPKDGGLVLAEVMAGSPADKAGLKKNDVLLKIGDSDVPTDPAAFTVLVSKLRGGDKLDAVVVRKGKKETVKGIELIDERRPAVRPNPVAPAGGDNVQIQVENGALTLTATVGGTEYAVNGSVENGKVTPAKITVGSGREAKEYDGLDKVPEADRAVVERLIARVKVRR